jgi:hypothetical protein
MNNLKWFKIITISLVVALVAGCAATTGLLGHNSKNVEKQTQKITQLQNKIEGVKDNKISFIQDFSYGTAYALEQVTNKEPAIAVAEEMNQRVQNIAGLPPLEREKEMILMVNGLVSNNIIGQRMLKERDSDIVNLQKEETLLLATKDVQIQKALELSTTVAMQADGSKQELSKYRGWLGLSAVWMGLKQFCTTSFWVLLGLVAAFIILSILAAFNPIASAIFSVFDVMLSWVVNCIKVVAPKALTLAGQVSSTIYNDAKGALTSIVDSVSTLKLTTAASGKQATIENLLDTLELSTTPAQKIIIEQIKQDLGWTTTASVSTIPASVTAPVTVLVPVTTNTATATVTTGTNTTIPN